MLKKVGIISSLYNSINFGAILQSYALERVISSLGYEARQILFNPNEQNTSDNDGASVTLVRKIVALLEKNGFLKSIKVVRNVYVHRKLSAMYKESLAISKRFADKFIDEHIDVTSPLNSSTVDDINNMFDIFVCGSDQIWNPNWAAKEWFLSFAADDKLKIAYAPSMGVDSLTEDQIVVIKPLINRLDAISVRELSSVSMLKSVTDKKVEFVLDPVLLLDDSEWDNVVTSFDTAQTKPYIYYYAHGNSLENITLANDIFSAYGLPVISTPSLSIRYGSYNFTKANTINRFDVGPGEFIDLIKNAEAVVTESFHATVLSILYRKPFYVLLRDSNKPTHSMNSRLFNLLKMVHLEDRIIYNFESFKNIMDDKIDYDSVHQILSVERERSYAYLRDSLKMKPTIVTK